MIEKNSKVENVISLHNWVGHFKKGYQPQMNIIKDKNSEYVVKSLDILNSRENYIDSLLNVNEADYH